MALPEVVFLGDAAVGGEVARDEQAELLPEVGAHLRYPLSLQALRGDDLRPPHQAPELELSHDETCLDGFTEANLIRQEIAHAVIGNGPGESPNLMRQRDDGRFDGRKQDVLGQRIGDPRRGGEKSDPVHGTDICFRHGPEARDGQPHDSILARQPDTADGLAPERLGLDDPAELPVLGAVVPVVRLNPHLKTTRLTPELFPRMRAAQLLQGFRLWRTRTPHSRSLPASVVPRRTSRHNRQQATCKE